MKNHIKKFLMLTLSFCLILSLSACSGNSDDKQNTEYEKSSAGDGGKVLVVYYSATGNTKKVAGYIAAATGADTFELVPVDNYTEEDLNYNDDNSRVSREHNDPDRQNIELITSTVENWGEYDTVFIGYPIWWQTAAWPVNGFVRTNDFTDKTVIPFCTSASSDMGDSGEVLEEIAGTGNWLKGQRFTSSVSESDIKTWIDSFKL